MIRGGLVGLIVLVTGTASAQPAPMTAEAKAHYDRGTALYNRADYHAAIVELDAGKQLDANPDFEYALGQAYRKLGDCPHAGEHYQAFLATHPPDSEAARTRLNLARCPALAEPDFTAPPGTEPVATPVTAAPTDQPAWYTDVPGGVLATAGVVGIAAGLTYFVHANRDVDLANLAGTIDALSHHADDAHHERVIGAIALSAGAALVGAAVVRYISVSRRSPDVGIAITPTGGSVQWTARF